eukprot:4350017-Amphidinium_carterae.1
MCIRDSSRSAAFESWASLPPPIVPNRFQWQQLETTRAQAHTGACKSHCGTDTKVAKEELLRNYIGFPEHRVEQAFNHKSTRHTP